MLNILFGASVYISFSTVGFLMGYIFRGSVQRWKDSEEQHRQMSRLKKEQYDEALKAHGDIQE